DADPDPALAELLDRRKAVAEVGLGCQAETHARVRLRQQVELARIRVCGVDDGRMRPEAAGLCEQLDRPQPVLREAFLDLTWLLVGVHVQRQALRSRIPPDLLEPVARARTHGVGREAHPHAARAYFLELREVVRRRLLTEALQPPAPVGGKQEHQLDPSRGRGFHGCVRLWQAEVVELTDRRVARRDQLAVDLDVTQTDLFGGQSLGQGQHGLAPRPEVAAFRSAPQGPLERVTVGVHEPRQAERLCHPRILSAWRRAQFRPSWPSFRTRSRSRAWPSSRSSSGSCWPPTTATAGPRRSCSARRRLPTRSTAGSPAAGTWSRPSGRSPTRSPT